MELVGNLIEKHIKIKNHIHAKINTEINGIQSIIISNNSYDELMEELKGFIDFKENDSLRPNIVTINKILKQHGIIMKFINVKLYGIVMIIYLI